MNIIYVANIRLPTEKAHGVQIMEMCNAFAMSGNAVELVVPKRRNHIAEEAFSFYSLPKHFLITRLFTCDLVRFGRLGFVFQSVTFTLSALLYLLRKRSDDVLVYGRGDDLFLFLWSFFGKPYAYEAHAPKWSFLTRRVVKRASLLIVISKGLKDFYCSQGVSEGSILVAPDGVNLARFTVVESKEECRIKVGLPLEKKIALYSGHLYERKGAQVFAEAAKSLDDVLCVFVGGTEIDIETFKERYGDIRNILIVGNRPHQDIPYYLRAADVLILPNSAKDTDARLYTSPMKLFEYMTSGTPIVASNVSSLREVLDEQCAVFFTPDDPSSLGVHISGLLADDAMCDRFGKQALCDVENFSWIRRAEMIRGRWHAAAV